MDENDVDRSSQRANLIEQRMFEITLSSIETLKHATAIELHKSQNEMKKRLRKYRDRQREIVRNRSDVDTDPIEVLMTRQMKNKAKAKMKSRPKTCAGQGRTGSVSPRSKSVTPRVPKSVSSRMSSHEKGNQLRLFCDSSSENESDDSNSDVELDGSFMIDQQKSKIDLRPKTAIDISRRGVSLEQFVNNGRLGPAVRQVRYFDEDELKDRGSFYRHLVDKRIQEENNKLNNLDDAVAKFCGSETIQTMTKKMQSKRNFFMSNQEWANNVSSKKKSQGGGDIKGGSQLGRMDGTIQKGSLRPNTSAGFHKPMRSNIKSFKRPSYIAT
ncbi:uncharacterized protein LOC128222819 [Mya arenaria]|uniref:uncharacterized protein LOC128222819 n=1 Tax=Mya arenaria TaxID=6604 RepID=UPI0022E3BAD4|nr:uncharacterized protein LOC128222819 [Mya arenaria]